MLNAFMSHPSLDIERHMANVFHKTEIGYIQKVNIGRNLNSVHVQVVVFWIAGLVYKSIHLLRQAEPVYNTTITYHQADPLYLDLICTFICLLSEYRSCTYNTSYMCVMESNLFYPNQYNSAQTARIRK